MSSVNLVSDTLRTTPSPGEIEYNGQFFATDSASSRAQMQRLSLQTAVPYTSFTTSTYHDFLNVPSWVKRITFMIANLSPGTDTGTLLLIQLGTSSGITTTGYSSQSGGSSSTNGFCIFSWGGLANTLTASITINLIDTNMWLLGGIVNRVDGTSADRSAVGSVTLPGTLTRIRLTSSTGTGNFDSGTINVLYEG